MTPLFNSNIQLPHPHARFLQNAIPRFQSDERIVGVAAGGSFITNALDEYSDLDIVIAIEPSAVQSVMNERQAIAQSLGKLLVTFTGEHVGEPRLLVCLYDAPILHVDLKFVSLFELANRVENPVILWEKNNYLSATFQGKDAQYPMPDLQWIEDRFWIWVHYGAVKIGRGELFEAIDFLAFLRAQVIGPLALKEQGARPSGVRKIEFLASDRAQEMKKTIATYDRSSCLASLRAIVTIYRALRMSLASDQLILHQDAEIATMRYVDEIETKLTR